MLIKIFALNFNGPEHFQNSQCSYPKILISDPNINTRFSIMIS
jgi:hypothetical protein